MTKIGFSCHRHSNFEEVSNILFEKFTYRRYVTDAIKHMTNK